MILLTDFGACIPLTLKRTRLLEEIDSNPYGGPNLESLFVGAYCMPL